MDTTGTFEVYGFKWYKLVTCFTKFYKKSHYEAYIKENGPLDPEYFMISTGINEVEFDDLIDLVEITNAKWICVDVANGYMEKALMYCKSKRSFRTL